MICRSSAVVPHLSSLEAVQDLPGVDRTPGNPVLLITGTEDHAVPQYKDLRIH